jgi:hypothetical protein
MAWKEVGTGTTLNDAVSAEALVTEGARAKLDMFFSVGVPSIHVDTFRSALTMAGVSEVEVSSAGSSISVTYRKGAWWVPVIVGLALISLAGLIIYLVLWKLSEEVSGPVLNLSFAAAGILAIAVAYAMFRRKY